jgi:hypothetical protein
MASDWDTRRTLRLSPEVLVGGYVDGRKGAVICVANTLAHLSESQTRQMVAYLQACLEQKQAS